MAIRCICLLAIFLLAAEAEVLQGNDANATMASLGEVDKVGTYDELMDETEDSSDDVDEDETIDEEGSGFSDDEAAAIKSEKGDEDETIKDDANATEVTATLIQDVDESNKSEDEVATEEDRDADKPFQEDDGTEGTDEAVEAEDSEDSSLLQTDDADEASDEEDEDDEDGPFDGSDMEDINAPADSFLQTDDDAVADTEDTDDEEDDGEVHDENVEVDDASDDDAEDEEKAEEEAEDEAEEDDVTDDIDGAGDEEATQDETKKLTKTEAVVAKKVGIAAAACMKALWVKEVPAIRKCIQASKSSDKKVLNQCGLEARLRVHAASSDCQQKKASLITLHGEVHQEEDFEQEAVEAARLLEAQ